MILLDKLRKGTNIQGDDACWIWEKAKFTDGYGHIRYKDKDYLTHRLSYEIFNGEIPKGKCVLHICDNRACVNPNHLYLGSKLDNCHDMINKNRHPTSKNKFTDQDIDDIKYLRNIIKYTYKELAERYNTTIYYIYSIVKGNRR